MRRRRCQREQREVTRDLGKHDKSMLRLACFFDDGQIVIISGFEKKTRRDRRSKTKLETAVRLRDDYLKQKGDST